MECLFTFSFFQNLEIKRINDEKKAALAAQFAAEATLRRVHAAQKDDDMPPIEAIITPLEAELKLARLEVTFQIIVSTVKTCQHLGCVVKFSFLYFYGLCMST